MAGFRNVIAGIGLGVMLPAHTMAASCYHIESPFAPGEEFGCTGGSEWILVEVRQVSSAIVVQEDIDIGDRQLLERKGYPNIKCTEEVVTETVEKSVEHSLNLGAQTELTVSVEAELRQLAATLRGQIGCKIVLGAEWSKTESLKASITRTSTLERCKVYRIGLVGQQNDGAIEVKIQRWEAVCLNTITGETTTTLCEGDFTTTTHITGTGWFEDGGWCECGKVFLPCCSGDEATDQPFTTPSGPAGPMIPYQPYYPLQNEDGTPWQPEPGTGYTGQALGDCNLICGQ